MIYVNSRYYDGPLTQVGSVVSVNRKFPGQQSLKIIGYIWKQDDRIDKVAAAFLKDPTAWHLIMDINPFITDPSNIAPGTPIRIPNGI